MLRYFNKVADANLSCLVDYGQATNEFNCTTPDNNKKRESRKWQNENDDRPYINSLL